ncbi:MULTISPECIES: DUF4365 domain-containing protein [unclassified Sphingobium]|uniref:DUF4365 domain-containing protein n=1 Tax=unclassified Sphingobium TaxID=2611147 RepID=UPI0022259E3F|nr:MULTISPECIES: DUF4365 domain-containing protein [unclassified Sphingobium]MCW2395305.1 hypothetical protein [Sphingobium sp. B8D3B]MCW2418820.1 hypothetical protein [Sphingobium sp. B8D3C]
MSITVEHIKENLCAAHIYAVAGMAGVCLGLRNVNDYGVDGQFDPVITRGSRRIISGIPLPFQAKSTINWEVKDGHVIYDLESKTYNDIVSRTDAEATLLLVLLCLPKEAATWHGITAYATTMRTCCYWHHFRGDPVPNEKSKKRIKIPMGQLLTPQSLNELLATEKARREAQVS